MGRPGRGSPHHHEFLRSWTAGLGVQANLPGRPGCLCLSFLPSPPDTFPGT